jgi:hypothetical protein
MSVLPSSVNYGETHMSLPEGTKCLTQVLSPVNGSSFSQNALIQFDFLNRGFILPDSIYLRYTYVITSAVSAQIIGTPAFTPFLRSEVLVGSQVIESINQYNQVCNMLCNTTLSVGEKYGMQQMFGYNDSTSVPTLDKLDGRLCILNETGSFSAPLPNILSSSEKLIPAFAMPQIRLQLTLDTIANMFTTAVVPTDFQLKNVELCYKMLDIPSAQAYTMGLDKFYIKSTSFTNTAVSLAKDTAGTLSLVFNQRLASIKAAIINFSGTDSTSLNKWGDSFAPSAAATYQLAIAGEYFPQRPLSCALNKSAVLMELKNALGSIYDRSNAMSINAVEFNRVSGDTTTYIEPAKHYVGISLEKMHSGLLTGISTQNSPISLQLYTTAVAQALTVNLILNYDALIEIDPQNKQVSVKQ